MKPSIRSLLPALLLCVGPFADPAAAFCGFYVGKAGSDLFNKASKVVLVRDGDRTVLTMASDYQGDLDEFALVIPSPTFLERDQIHVTEMKYLDHLDAYTAPRLVEYFDDDPCMVMRPVPMAAAAEMSAGAARMAKDERAKALGVTVEATYTVGEYDILILSAKESDGLETWLKENGYKIPEGAARVLDGYIKQKLRFFVAKVNLKRQKKLGFDYLRPIQIAYESPKFVLPIRLGTVNANGPQELFVFAMTRTGRIETTNYRTVKLPTDAELPPYVKEEFPDFYRAMFDRQVELEGMRAVFLEYAWDMAWCDPCAADPLSPDELRELGVFWMDEEPFRDPNNAGLRPRTWPGPGSAPDVFVTRLHIRYDGEHFPEDLVFQQTGDRSNFQGRYVLRHPWKGSPDKCPEARRYFRELEERREREARTLSELTGWPMKEVRRKAGLIPDGDTIRDEDGRPKDNRWWRRLWDRD